MKLLLNNQIYSLHAVETSYLLQYRSIMSLRSIVSLQHWSMLVPFRMTFWSQCLNAAHQPNCTHWKTSIQSVCFIHTLLLGNCQVDTARSHWSVQFSIWRELIFPDHELIRSHLVWWLSANQQWNFSYYRYKHRNLFASKDLDN